MGSRMSLPITDNSRYREEGIAHSKRKINLRDINPREIFSSKNRREIQKNPYQEKLQRIDHNFKNENPKKKRRRNLMRRTRGRAYPEKLPFAGNYIRRSSKLNLFSSRLGRVDLASVQRQEQLSLLSLKKKK